MKQILSFAVTISIVLIVSSSAMAIGIGMYGEVQRGSTKYAQDFSGSSDDIGVFGGLMVDTNLAKDSIFNYRFKLGAGQTWSKGQSINKLSLIQTFGISPAQCRGDMVRFWFGPRIGLHYLNGDFSERSTNNPFGMFVIMAMGVPIVIQDTEIKMNGVKGDIGLVLAGLNFNFGPIVTLSFEFGFNYGYLIGKAEYTDSTSWLTAAGEGIEGFATMAVLFRINDTYSGQEKPEKMKIQIQP